MGSWAAWLGDIHRMVSTPGAEVLLVLVAAVAGGLVGCERELKAKAAGVRTLALISVGSAIYTMISITLAGGRFDPARIAAQIVPGIGFLGAGAILREHGMIVGLTTAASIWTVAAIGVVVGAGYGVAGLVLSCMVVTILIWVQRLERALLGPCRFGRFRISFEAASGKAWIRICGLFDDHHVVDPALRPTASGDGAAEFGCCDEHIQHRAHLPLLAQIPEVRSLERMKS